MGIFSYKRRLVQAMRVSNIEKKHISTSIIISLCSSDHLLYPEISTFLFPSSHMYTDSLIF
jgi:hypothetical protein